MGLEILKIAVLGASVSAQSVNRQTGEITGYCEALRRDHLTEIGAQSLEQFTYPGNRLSDGGMILLSDVIAVRPDICLIEPLIEDDTRGQPASEAEATYVYSALIKAGITPVTVFLPQSDALEYSELTNYRLHKSICDKLGVKIIPVSLAAYPGAPGTFFEGIHTKPPGAAYYAAKIAADLRELPKLPPVTIDPNDLPVHVSRTPQGAAPDVLAVKFLIEAESPCEVRLTQRQWVGPYSPVLDVIVSSSGESINEPFSIWDAWCHYVRPSFVTFWAGTIPAGSTEVAISCSSADPDYSVCRRHVERWPQPEDRRMRPIGPVHIISDGPASVSAFDLVRA